MVSTGLRSVRPVWKVTSGGVPAVGQPHQSLSLMHGRLGRLQVGAAQQRLLHLLVAGSGVHLLASFRKNRGKTLATVCLLEGGMIGL